MRILVIGGAGYIGSHTCKALRRAGYEPVVFDNLSTGHTEFVRWGPLIEGDILDAAHLKEVFAKDDYAGVVLFAALAYVGESVGAPDRYYRTNVVGTLNVLDAMVAAGVPAAVFSSSCATYGEVKTLPITEDTPQTPVNPYGRTKLIAEHALADYNRAYGLRSICLRYFNACGADPDGEIGERHDPETHLIPRAVLAAQGKIDDFAVFGSDYATPDGTAVRDYIHVADLAGAHVLALNRLLNDQGLQTEHMNVGTGRGYSIAEIIGAIERQSGRSLPHTVGPRREGDPPELVADCRKAKDVIGFEATHSALDNIIATAWSWHGKENVTPK